MFGQQLSSDILITSDVATITGTTTIDSTPVDMAGFTGVLFIVKLGTPAGNNNIRAQQDTTVGMGAAADLAGTLVASGANPCTVLEVMNVGKQFLRCRVTRGTSTTLLMASPRSGSGRALGRPSSRACRLRRGAAHRKGRHDGDQA